LANWLGLAIRLGFCLSFLALLVFSYLVKLGYSEFPFGNNWETSWSLGNFWLEVT